MSQKTDVTQAMMSEFYRITQDRLPAEACGVMIPTPHRERYIWEMPNRSMKPQTGFKMQSSDVRYCIGEWIENNPDLLTEVTFWHSHPSGNAEPSDLDLQHKVENAKNLVVAITKENQLSLTWY